MSTPIPIRSERRLGVVFAAFLALFVLMSGRLFELQFLRSDDIETGIAKRRHRHQKLQAYRGNILDRQGRPFATTVNRYDLAFLPTNFREGNRIDALQDLLVAWCPEVLPAGFGEIPLRFNGRVVERLQRFRQVYSLRQRGIEQLLSLSVSDLVFEKPHLVRRFEKIRYPAGELILPPSKLKRRLEAALLILANNEVCSTLRDLRSRMATFGTLAEVLSVTPESVNQGLEDQWEKLQHFSDQIVSTRPGLFLTKMFEMEQRDLVRVRRRVENSLDDAICAIELGSHDLGNYLSKEQLESLAAELDLGRDKAKELEPVLKELLEQEAQADNNEIATKLAAARGILRGRNIGSLAPYELKSLARVLEFWDNDPQRLKRAFAKRFKASPAFVGRREEYLKIEKEWHRTLQFKGGVPFTLFRGCGFPVAAQVWRSFGLGELGFEVRASQGRSYWADEKGVAAQLIGRRNGSGDPLGGLELALSIGGKDKGIWNAPLLGQDGVLRKRQELDGRWRIIDGGREPEHGKDVWLTLDREMQAEAETLMGEMFASLGSRTGAACCVIDVETGEIVLLASAPTSSGTDYLERYLEEATLRRALGAAKNARDSGDLSARDYFEIQRRIREELYYLAFFERSVEAGTVTQSPPGSVLKCFAAAALAQEGLFKVGEIFDCPEKGPVNIWLALERSSNPFFWEGAKRLGRKALIDWYQQFGLFRPIPLLTKQRDCDARLKQVRNDAAKNIVIGQGSVSLSVLEVASMMTNLAREGRCIEPMIVKRIGSVDLKAKDQNRIEVDRTIFEEITQAMLKVSGHYVDPKKVEELGLAGKTGTAELGGKDKGLYNAWFAGFAPASKPKYAFAVVAERTGLMGKTTAPFAARLIEMVMRLKK